MSTITVGKTWKTQRELIILGNRHIRVLSSAAYRSIPKDTPAEIIAVGRTTVTVDCKAGGGWGLKLEVQRVVWGNSFTPDTGPARKLPPPNLSQVFHKLSQRQKAVREGMEAMQEARKQLRQDMSSANTWGTLAVVANAAMMPLNIIVNAFEVGEAASIYQRIVKDLYGKFGKSGTRIDGKLAKEGLGLLKKITLDHLKKRGLSHYIPGVNIIIGMAEDSVAFIETASMVSAGNREMSQLLRQLDAKIVAAEREFGRIGIEMDRLLTEMDRRRRTA